MAPTSGMRNDPYTISFDYRKIEDEDKQSRAFKDGMRIRDAVKADFRKNGMPTLDGMRKIFNRLYDDYQLYYRFVFEGDWEDADYFIMDIDWGKVDDKRIPKVDLINI